MLNPVYSDLKTKLENELDLQEENFVTATEFKDYYNRAIGAAEKIVLDLYEDYFLDSAPLVLVQGQQAYSLPAGIFANKIREIIYSNGPIEYEIRRLHGSHKFARFANSMPGEYYRYLLKNSAASGPQIILNQPALSSDSTSVTIWHLREAKRVVLDTDPIEIPEAEQFIQSFVKVKCLQKDVGNPMLDDAKADLITFKTELEGVLADMVPDDHNEVEADLSTYFDHS